MLVGECREHPAVVRNTLTVGEDGILTVAGRRAIVLVATHGNMRDDMGTAEFTLAVRERLDCYAVSNTRFRKGVKTDVQNDVADLYKREAFLHPALKVLFWDRLTGFLDRILTVHPKALVIHVHGIKDGNILKIARLMNGDPAKAKYDARVVIGYGQHFKNPRYTADERAVVKPLIESLTRSGLPALPAPVDPIYNNGHKTWYCGNDRNRLNQYLVNQRQYRQRLESLQIELRYTGVRDHQGLPEAATRFADAVSAVWNS